MVNWHKTVPKSSGSSSSRAWRGEGQRAVEDPHNCPGTDPFLPLGWATFSLHSISLRLCVKLPDVVRTSPCRLKPWCFPGTCLVPDAVLALENKDNCQPISVRLFLMLFIIHFRSNTTKASPLRDWQLLSPQQYSKLLLTAGNRKP